MKNCKISTICFENTLFPLPSFFILKKKKKGLHKETWRKVWMLIRSPNSFNKKEKELRAFTHWLIKVEVSRRALITRARDPIGEGSDRPFNVSTRGGGRRGGGSGERGLLCRFPISSQSHETSFRRLPVQRRSGLIRDYITASQWGLIPPSPR